MKIHLIKVKIITFHKKKKKKEKLDFRKRKSLKDKKNLFLTSSKIM